MSIIQGLSGPLDADVEAFRNQVHPEASYAEVRMFLGLLDALQLKPGPGIAYLLKMRVEVGGRWVDRWQPVIGIDGYRNAAARNGLVQTRHEFRAAPDAPWHPDKGEGRPFAARCTVTRRVKEGEHYDTTHEVLWVERAQYRKDGTLRGQWAKQPWHMLGKCAEAGALRQAFPMLTENGTAYIPEEVPEPIEVTATVADPHPPEVMAVYAAWRALVATVPESDRQALADELRARIESETLAVGQLDMGQVIRLGRETIDLGVGDPAEEQALAEALAEEQSLEAAGD